MQDILSFLQVHWALSLSALTLIILLFVFELARLKTSAQRITPLQLTQLVNHKDAVVVDMRPTDEFAKGHIIGAVSMPAAEFKLNSKKIDKFKSKPIVLVCSKGQESLKMASELKTQGFHVHVLGGGISSWTGAEMPTVKD